MVDNFPRPGLLRRLAALVYDGILLVALLLAATVPVLLLTDGQPVAPGNPWYRLYLFVICGSFFCFFWIRGGQTLGMRAWRLRVVTQDGMPLDLRHCVIRFLSAIPSIAFVGLGFLWVAIDQEGCAWHDRLSRTRVILLPQNRGQRS